MISCLHLYYLIILFKMPAHTYAFYTYTKISHKHTQKQEEIGGYKNIPLSWYSITSLLTFVLFFPVFMCAYKSTNETVSFCRFVIGCYYRVTNTGACSDYETNLCHYCTIIYVRDVSHLHVCIWKKDCKQRFYLSESGHVALVFQLAELHPSHPRSPRCWCCLHPERCPSGDQLWQNFCIRMSNDQLGSWQQTTKQCFQL